ncbi:MAG TPA: 2'-5' RNA ligase family protein [Burkholderiales bacterium]|nr:2'-5' RNA ligase family protein [Burkholderiales bacterium]
MPKPVSSSRFAAKRQIDRLFFAIFPDALTAERIENLGQHLCTTPDVKGRTLARDRFHVSLYHVGDYEGVPQDIVAMAEEAAATVTVPAFQVAFDHMMSFSGRPGHRPLVLRSSSDMAGLMAFQTTLSLAMEKVMPGHKGGARFNPHLTVLYGDHRIEHTVESIAWIVHEFVLVHSLVGRTRYVPLKRWPLRN